MKKNIDTTEKKTKKANKEVDKTDIVVFNIIVLVENIFLNMVFLA